MHVDHIIPLIHENSCGLNIPENLQITTATFNTSKRNRIDLSKIEDYLEESSFIDGVRVHNSVLNIIEKINEFSLMNLKTN